MILFSLCVGDWQLKIFAFKLHMVNEEKCVVHMPREIISEKGATLTFLRPLSQMPLTLMSFSFARCVLKASSTDSAVSAMPPKVPLVCTYRSRTRETQIAWLHNGA